MDTLRNVEPDFTPDTGPPQPAGAGSTPKFIYEDQLPEMTDAEYDAWYARSWIADGVRVGPPIIYRATLKPVFDFAAEHAKVIRAWELRQRDIELNLRLDEREQIRQFRKFLRTTQEFIDDAKAEFMGSDS